MDKQTFKELSRFYLVNPAELEDFAEWVEYLDALLHGPCTIWEEDGKLELIETKVLVDVVNGLKIMIYPNEHAPPHFHVVSANIDASFRISDCSLIDGKISSNDYKKILFWHQRSRQSLIDKRNSTRPTDCKVGVFRETT